MIKYILLISIFISPFIMTAQKGIPDFSVTDIYGKKHTLKSDYLDKGKYVYLDFFTVGCGGCISSAPKIDTVFREFGCNYGDVIFLAIDAGHYSPYGTDSTIWEFTKKNIMTFPSVSGIDGDGYSVYVDFGNYLDFSYTPYHILISPNKKVVMDNTLHLEDPAVNSDQLRDSLVTNYGMQTQQCDGNDFMFFSLVSNTDSVVGKINEEAKTISVNFSSKTDLSSLKASYREGVNSTVKINGVLQENGITINDFSSPITYEVTSEKGNIENWTVNVSTSSNINFLNKKFNIYPNPSEGIIILENSFYKNSSNNSSNVSITNIAGKNLKTFKFNSANIVLDLSNYPKGIYFINIETKLGISSKKIVLF